jgi:uncharacterized GH25 family protein
MKRFASLTVALLLLAAPVRAHFLWIVPDEPADGKPATHIIFSDDLNPGAADLLKKVAKTEAYARNLDLKTTDLKLTEDKNVLRVGVKEKGQVLGAVCKYGVFQKGNDEPALIYYYAKSYAGEDLKKPPPDNLMKPWDKLALEIVPLVEEKKTVQVLWQGKPLAGAEVVLLVPGDDKPVQGMTDKDGLYKVVNPKANGVYGIRALYTEKTAGEYDGKKYNLIRHYATLTFPVDKSSSK